MKVTMQIKKDTFYVDTTTGYFTGSTYGVKDWIKENFDAKWNSSYRRWEATPERVEKELQNKRYYTPYIVNVPTQTTTTKTYSANGICPHCHTYCFGDCQAN